MLAPRRSTLEDTMNRYPCRTSALAVFLASAAVACAPSAPTEPSLRAPTSAAPEAAAPEAEAPSPNAAEAAPSPRVEGAWSRVDTPTEAQQAMADLGVARRTQLAQGLVGALTRAIADQGLAAAVDACHLEAPTVTAAVQGIEAGVQVRVGRTSDRLRNPDNAAPDWVAQVLASDAPVGTWQSGDAIGLVSPIPTVALCTGCHGLEADLAPDVRASLARLYPDDQATGYAEGDTRGWFWVEVRPSS